MGSQSIDSSMGDSSGCIFDKRSEVGEPIPDRIEIELSKDANDLLRRARSSRSGAAKPDQVTDIITPY